MFLPSRRATIQFGHSVARILSPGDLVILKGDLGAGKTFLARAIARGLGVTNQQRVTSPTFTLVQEYEAEKGLVVHSDLYRILESHDLALEVARLHLREQQADGAIVLVEWGDSLIHLLGEPALTIELRRAEENEGRARNVTFSGERAARLSSALATE